MGLFHPPCRQSLCQLTPPLISLRPSPCSVVHLVTGLVGKMQFSGNKQVLREAWQAGSDGEWERVCGSHTQQQQHMQQGCEQLLITAELCGGGTCVCFSVVTSLSQSVELPLNPLHCCVLLACLQMPPGSRTSCRLRCRRQAARQPPCWPPAAAARQQRTT